MPGIPKIRAGSTETGTTKEALTIEPLTVTGY